MTRRYLAAVAAFAALVASGSAQAQGHFYGRLDTGWSFARDAKFKDKRAIDPNCFLIVTVSGVCGGELNHLGSSFVLGIGVGYQFPGGFRADYTYGHRSGYDLKGKDPAGTSFDPKVQSDSHLVNGYFDLPKWGSVKPYIGGGIGWSRNKMDRIKWNDGGSSGVLTGGKKTDRAYQITIGAVFEPADKLKLDIGYRYFDFGRIHKAAGPDQSGMFNASGITGPADGKLRAHEILFSIRREL